MTRESPPAVLADSLGECRVSCPGSNQVAAMPGEAVEFAALAPRGQNGAASPAARNHSAL